MILKRAVIENYRAITRLELDLHERMNVFIGANGDGKTSVLNAIAVGLGAIPKLLPEVSSVDFLETDCRGTGPVRVELETRDGTRWERSRRGQQQADRLDGLGSRLAPLLADESDEKPPDDLPIAAFYGTDRVVPESPPPIEESRGYPRFGALEGAFAPRPDFRDSLTWFREKEHEEANQQKRRRSPDYLLPQLDAVCRAIRSMDPDIADPSVDSHLVRDTVGRSMHIEIAPGGGRGIVSTLAMDLARRMAQGNPHLDDPLQAEAVVLIDEVDLHLYPSWQQRILPDLMRTFPNAQFLVSTQSPQVLTTVEAHCIFHLAREDGELGAFGVPIATYGARASDALATVMGVDERPAGNEFVEDLRRYLDMVADGEGESLPARSLRKQLVEMAPEDPDLSLADLEIRRQRVMRDWERK